MTAIALITGGNRGLGYEIARKLATQGVTAIIGARDEERGRRAAAHLGQPWVQLDVTDPASVAAAAKWIEQEYGRLDILVNNAGISGAPEAGSPSATTVETLRQVLETNLVGVVMVTNAMLPLLRKSAAGRIVNQSTDLGSIERMTDRSGPLWRLNNMAYNASKAALNMVTTCYAKELWGTRIKVNAVTPGFCRTRINGYTGFRPAEHGARIAVRLATVGANGPTAGFFGEDGPVPW